MNRDRTFDGWVAERYRTFRNIFTGFHTDIHSEADNVEGDNKTYYLRVVIQGHKFSLSLNEEEYCRNILDSKNLPFNDKLAYFAADIESYIKPFRHAIKMLNTV